MHRKRRRKISYRPRSQRPIRIFRMGLACVALAALMLSAGVIARSVKTAKLNRRLAEMHTVDGESPVAQIAAPPLAQAIGAGRTPEQKSDDMGGTGLTLARMTLPDGSAIAETDLGLVTTAFHNTLGDVLPDMLKLLKSNTDTVGWLYIDGIVHLPVVYRDNDYYLTHDFNGNHNTSGTLFLDQASPVTAQTQNLLIHGHSMVDGSMFGLLTHYRKLDTLTQHPLISFSTLWEKETYVIFAVLVQSPEEFDYYSHPFFTSSAAFETYVDAVRDRSRYDIPVDVQPTDALLTLSTCIDDDRLVVLARRLRAGESKDELVSAVAQSIRL